MSDEKSTCCDTDNSDCNTQEANCCSTEKKSSSNEKKIGLGILVLAITFAVASAFTTGNPNEKSNCNTGETGCETSCETGNAESTKSVVSSCCSKK